MTDPADTKPKPAHTLADHAYGMDFAHTHDGEADHDHDRFDDSSGEDPLWAQDHVTLTSVGIDIGSSGTQVVFSQLNLRRFGEQLSSRYYVVGRETLYQSPVSLTPYIDDEHIDGAQLGAIIDTAYAAAQQHPDKIDAGVVILTGEALRRDNAQAIADVLADQGGEFVCATAGHHMEAMLAAYGSGAARVSSDTGKRILNIDIGGGTTKLAVIEQGRVLETAAVHIGGRLMVVDDAGRITRLDPAGKYHAAQAGYSWQRGDIAGAAAMDRVAEAMADQLVAALIVRPLPADIERLYLTEPIRDFGHIDGVRFSGGVGEYIYQREQRDFYDMGKRLGLAVRLRVDQGHLPWSLLPAGECMRATALGASEYSVQLSGNTTYISNHAALLPRKNLQVLQPTFEFGEHVDADALARSIRAHFEAFDLVEGDNEAALAFRWAGAPSYQRIRAFAEGLCRGLAQTIARHKPLFIMLDGDIAHTLGTMLRDEMGVASEILVIDGVTLQDFDFIDLGRIRMPSQTVPVTVKSLVFSEDPRVPQGQPHLHMNGDHHHHGHDHHHHDHDHHHHHDHGHEHNHGPRYFRNPRQGAGRK